MIEAGRITEEEGGAPGTPPRREGGGGGEEIRGRKIEGGMEEDRGGETS